MSIEIAPHFLGAAGHLAQASQFPRLRYMGSKYRLAPHLARVFGEIGGGSAIDAFSGSGFVSYLLKAMGYSVFANDFLEFPATIARATVANGTVRLHGDLVELICGPPADDRDFIRSTFGGRFLGPDDLRFLDNAWSHIDNLRGAERDLALSALILSAARKQPRGVFTFVGHRYDDGRRDLRLSMADHFREHAVAYNAAVFDNGRDHVVTCGDVSDINIEPASIVYLDPPYAPPTDDADYMKRYHFLEGLALYWRGVEIMEHTKTKKIAKRYTPFAYKKSIAGALADTFERFRESDAIVLSYSSNAVPDAQEIVTILRQFKRHVTLTSIPHTYSFGTHSSATRRDATELIFVGRD